MALFTINGFSAEEATSKYVYENLFQGIQHINGKGCIDKYTLTDDVRSVTKIDVMRLKPVVPALRKLGAANNGGFMNRYNTPGSGNSPQSVNYTVDVDLFFDRNIPIAASQLFANKLDFETIVQAEVVDAMTWGVNIVTFAKQIEGFFRNGDNFDKVLAHNKGSIVAADITAGEIAKAIYAYDATIANDAAKKFVKANASLTNGVPEIGAFAVPVSFRQAFISSNYNAELKSQYSSNASEAAANINATGFMNPFTQTETTRIDERTGLCGMYDGVPMFLLTESTKQLVYVYLGVLGTADDTDDDLVAARAALDTIDGMIVYGAGTCRGMAIPQTVEVNKDPFNAQSVIIAPLMKMGVDVLHGATIKIITNSAMTAATIATVMNTIGFTPIDDDGTLAATALSGYDFNDGTTK